MQHDLIALLCARDFRDEPALEGGAEGIARELAR
jgi:hypothetical protein